jgi:AdoMet-dependent heme synthase
MATRVTEYGERPHVVIWETTRACDRDRSRCWDDGPPSGNAVDLSTQEARRLIEEIAALRVPVLVLSGDDPLKRADIFELVEHAASRGVQTTVALCATPLLTRRAIAELKRRGLARMAIHLEGSNTTLHDGICGVPGSYQETMRAIRWARELELPLQVNSTLTRRNVADVEAMIHLLERLEIVLWSVSFLPPAGRGHVQEQISAEEFEKVFQQLYDASQRVRFEIRTTEAPHYCRFALQRRVEELRRRALGDASVGSLHTVTSGTMLQNAVLASLSPLCLSDHVAGLPRGLNDGKGCVFVSHRGEVYPSGFLPLSGGNIREESLAEIYRHSPLFVALRDSEQLEGKCSICEFREVCGGSRGRAFAVTGNPFAQDPCCTYVPPSPRWRARAATR